MNVREYFHVNGVYMHLFTINGDRLKSSCCESD